MKLQLGKMSQRSQKSVGGTIGKTRQVSHVSEGQTVYHEIFQQRRCSGKEISELTWQFLCTRKSPSAAQIRDKSLCKHSALPKHL